MKLTDENLKRYGALFSYEGDSGVLFLRKDGLFRSEIMTYYYRKYVVDGWILSHKDFTFPNVKSLLDVCDPLGYYEKLDYLPGSEVILKLPNSTEPFLRE